MTQQIKGKIRFHYWHGGILKILLNETNVTEFMAEMGLSRLRDQTGCYLCHNVFLLLYVHLTIFPSFYVSSDRLYRFLNKNKNEINKNVHFQVWAVGI